MMPPGKCWRGGDAASLAMFRSRASTGACKSALFAPRDRSQHRADSRASGGGRVAKAAHANLSGKTGA